MRYTFLYILCYFTYVNILGSHVIFYVHICDTYYHIWYHIMKMLYIFDHMLMRYNLNAFHTYGDDFLCITYV